MNPWRILGIFLRNFYLIRQSLHRIFGLFYWTTLDVFLWGFITLWIQKIANPNFKTNLLLFFLGALIFWHLFTRSQQTITISFLEDVWTRNLMNIFATPINTFELFLGLISLSAVQSSISFLLALFLAYFLYGLNITSLGIYLLPFIFNIFFFGWSLGIFTTGLFVRFGPAVDILAWSIPVLFYPFSAVFYPVSILPQFLQKIAFFLPTSHLFEGMRSVLKGEILLVNEIFLTIILNIIYLFISFFFFQRMLSIAKKRGTLVRFIEE